jgi:hypothetical protein
VLTAVWSQLLPISVQGSKAAAGCLDRQCVQACVARQHKEVDVSGLVALVQLRRHNGHPGGVVSYLGTPESFTDMASKKPSLDVPRRLWVMRRTRMLRASLGNSPLIATFDQEPE